MLDTDLSRGSGLLMVAPTYNERANLEFLAGAFFGFASDAHLLIVDDRSPDGTAERCRELAAQYPRLHCLERSGPRGLGRAYLEGMQWGLERGFAVVGTMDADLSHHPRHLPSMIQALGRADVVVGSRYVRDGGTVNWRVRRILLSRTANAFAARLLNLPAHDVTSGFRLYRAEVMRRISFASITSNGYSFLAEMLYRLRRAGASIAEVPIMFHDRTLGVSKLAPREIYVGAYRLVRLRLRRLD